MLGVKQCALVLGNTIHLHGASTAQILADTRWLRHEAAHVLQYQRYGYWPFLLRYAWFSLRYGYQNNPLEAEARFEETNPDILTKIRFREKIGS